MSGPTISVSNWKDSLGCMLMLLGLAVVIMVVGHQLPWEQTCR